MTRLGALAIMLFASTVAGAKTTEDVSIDTYLSLLSQVAPAARDGAEAYLAAYEARCGRPMRALQLRQAVAAGSGHPTLMAMVRAAHARNAAALQRLRHSVVCEGG